MVRLAWERFQKHGDTNALHRERPGREAPRRILSTEAKARELPCHAYASQLAENWQLLKQGETG